MCQFLSPDPVRIKEKGHIITKTHAIEYLAESKNFNADYLTNVVKKQISDFVQYIEDEYDLEDFLQFKSDFKTSKLPKLLYFDDNLLAPMFLRKVAAFLDGRIYVGVTDDTLIAKKYKADYDSLILLEYDFETEQYSHRNIPFDSENPIQTLK